MSKEVGSDLRAILTSYRIGLHKSFKICIGEGILDTFFWKVQNTLADFMSGNNHFLLGLEFDNQTFDAVCGC